jgi:competence protein ComEC
MRCLVLLSAWVLLAPPASGQVGAGRAAQLGIYLIDVEGGGATLFVSPSGESLLVDTGNGGPSASRDAGRIVAAMEDAGLSEIDYLITTHWHGDHFGGMAELADRVPIRHYIDHGPSVQPNPGTDAFIAGPYRDLYARADRSVVRPGDRIPIDGLDVTVLASGGEATAVAVEGGGLPNPYCADFTPQPEDTGENAQSVGILVRLGAFRALHLGDLTANKEFALMCPTNPIGTVDLFVVSHHGQPSSNQEVLVHAVGPRVAIMNNGTRKGGQPEAMRVIHSSPGLENLWQLHFSLLSGQEYTVPGLFIANTIDAEADSMPLTPSVPPAGRGGPPPPAHDGRAYWIRVSAASDGAFTVVNSRNGFAKDYE